MKNMAFLRSIALTMVGLFLSTLLFSQQKPSLPYVAPDAPVWMKMLTAENPNVFEVQKAYTQYFENQAFEKSSYTQYFKHWMHWARPFVQADGSIKEPDAAALEAREKTLLGLRSNANQRGGNSAGWSFLGPKQTFDTDGLTEVTWQTNVYSIDISLSNPNVLYAGGETGGV